MVWRWDNADAFGSSAPDEDPDRDGRETIINLRLPGQVYDAESGLHYNWHRYYDPLLGRYISADPIGLLGGRNGFGYARGNPFSHADPNGLSPVAGAWAGAGAGSALGPAGTIVGGLIGAGAGAWIGWNIFGPMFQDKTPNSGEPGSWHTNPGSGQERLYGPDGRPAVDIDWDHDHENPDGSSAGTPHGHNWDWSQKPPRSFPIRVSPWPRGRACPAD